MGGKYHHIVMLGGYFKNYRDITLLSKSLGIKSRRPCHGIEGRGPHHQEWSTECEEENHHLVTDLLGLVTFCSYGLVCCQECQIKL